MRGLTGEVMSTNYEALIAERDALGEAVDAIYRAVGVTPRIINVDAFCANLDVLFAERRLFRARAERAEAALADAAGWRAADDPNLSDPAKEIEWLRARLATLYGTESAEWLLHAIEVEEYSALYFGDAEGAEVFEKFRDGIDRLITERDAATIRAELAEAALARCTRERDRARELLRELRSTNSPTGVDNRTFWDAALADEEGKP